jgi:acyl-CoA synthetase (AMP-forming)/AMP-acid ligase II
MVAITDPDDDPEWISTWSGGKALPGVGLGVVDDDGNVVAVGKPGELLVTGWNIMHQYYKDPEATAVIEKGWLHTGDIAIMHERGDFEVTDRKKDMYIAGGFNVCPAEVESILMQMGSVSQVAVIGMPDSRLGEVGAVYVTLRLGAEITAGDINAFAREHMANFKVPRRLEIVAKLTLNASGKVLKGELRAAPAAQLGPPEA